MDARYNTILEALIAHASEQPEHAAFNYMDGSDDIQSTLTYAELYDAACRWAHLVELATEKGDRVILSFRPGLEFAAAFLGTLLCGRIAVPTTPPSRRGKARFQRIVNDCEPALLLCSGSLSELLGNFLDGRIPLFDELQATQPWLPDQLPEPDQIAFLQYTSGSTSEPKGVVVSHKNIAVNEAYIEVCFGHDKSSRILGWLPVYHDMGLIGTFLQPLWLGSTGYIMNPSQFMKNPISWLQAIARYRITTSGGPNFAFDLCVERLPADLEIDLSCWQVAFNGAEPVRQSTLDNFSSTFADFGFRQEAFLPCYGLAEATLFVTGKPSEQSIVTMNPALCSLRDTSSANRQQNLLSSGKSLDGTEICIVDADKQQAVANGEEGELWIRGPSVCNGYWNNAQVSQETFGLTVDGRGGWLNTGDLAFQTSDGELFITGRSKDLIIIRGRNVYPQDLEASAETRIDGVAVSGAAAFQSQQEPDGAEMAIELARNNMRDPQDIAREVFEAVVQEYDIALHAVYILPANSLPKTTSGKVQRSLTRNLLGKQHLQPVACWSVRSETSNDQAQSSQSRELTENSEPTPLLANQLRELISKVTRLPAQDITADASLPSLGVDSLMLMTLLQQLEQSFALSISPEELQESSLSSLLARMQGSSGAGLAAGDQTVTSAAVTTVDVTDSQQPLSLQQMRFLLLDDINQSREDQCIAVTALLSGDIDDALLQRAINAAVARHPMLRMRFSANSRKTVGQLVEITPIVLEKIAAAASSHEARSVWKEKAALAFDRQQGPLLRAGFIPITGGAAILGLATDHIVSDGWSVRELLTEIFSFYEAGLAFKQPVLADLGNPFEFAHKQQILRGNPDTRGTLDEVLQSWQMSLTNVNSVLNLPRDNIPRTDTHSHTHTHSHGAMVTRAVAAPVLQLLRNYAGRHKVSNAAVWLAAYAILLARLADQQDVLIGTPVAHRDTPDAARLIGLFLDVLPLRINLSDKSALDDVVIAANDALGQLAAGKVATLDEILERVDFERIPNRPPLFQTLFNYLSGAHFTLSGEASTWQIEPILDIGSKFELTLYVIDGTDTELCLVYNTDYFTEQRVQIITDQLLVILDELLSDSSASWQQLSLNSTTATATATTTTATATTTATTTTEPATVTTAEVETATATSPISFDYPWTVPIHQKFAEYAVSHGMHTALIGAGGNKLSYQEMNSLGNSFAARLQAAGVGAGDRVAILAQRDASLPVAVLSVLKSGAAFTILDAGYPHERLSEYLDILAPHAIVSSTALAVLAHAIADASNMPVIEIDLANSQAGNITDSQFVTPTIQPEDPACYTFTSGSSGKPRLLVGTHGGLVAFQPWISDTFELTSQDQYSMLSGLSHDPLQRDLFNAWWAGGAVQVPPEASLRDMGIAWKWLLDSGTTIANLTPSSARYIIAGQTIPHDLLKRLFLVGEAIDTALLADLRKLFPNAQLISLYGATETQRVFLYYRHDAATPLQSVPLGTPSPYVQIDLQNSAGIAAGIGELGELVFKSRALAAACFDAQSTPARVEFDTDADGIPVYRTGDWARREPDGSLLFWGRADRQIKRHGVRMDLSEIEAVAKQLGYSSPLAHWWESDDVLALYLISTEELGSDSVRRAMAQRLPATMLPSQIHVLDKYPLTSQGKMDTGKLPRTLDLETQVLTSVQKDLADIFLSECGSTDISLTASFIQHGGNSLKAVLVQAKVLDAFGVQLPISMLLGTDTFADVCEKFSKLRLQQCGQSGHAGLPGQSGQAHEKAREKAHEKAIELVPMGDPFSPFPLNDIQRAYWIGRTASIGSINVGSQSYYEFDVSGLDIERFEAAWNQVITRHDMLRAVVDAGGEQRVLENVPHYSIEHFNQDDDIVRGIRTDLRRSMSSEQFDCTAWPMFDLRFTETRSELRLHIAFDFLLADAWSFGILSKELQQLYVNPHHELPVLAIGFRDYVITQYRERDTAAWKRARDFWTSKLPDISPAPQLPMENSPENIKSPVFLRHSRQLSATAMQQLESGCLNAGVTINALVLSALSTVFDTWSQSPAFTINLTIFDRRPLHPDVASIVGDFTSVLLLSMDLSSRRGFAEQCRVTQQSLNEALDNRAFSGVEVMREINAQNQSPGLLTMPIVMTSKLGLRRNISNTTDVFNKQIYGVSRTPQVWLDAQVVDSADGGLNIDWDVVEGIFPSGLIDDMLDSFAMALTTLAEDINAWSQPLNVALPQWQQQIINTSNATDTPLYAESLARPALLNAQSHPASVAVIDAYGRQLNHGQLQTHACQLADRLTAELTSKLTTRLTIRSAIQSVDLPVDQPATRFCKQAIDSRAVPVLTQKGHAQIIAVYACLIAGCPYVPVDPAQGKERIAQIFNKLDCGVALVDTDESAELCRSLNLVAISVGPAKFSDPDPGLIAKAVHADAQLDHEQAAYIIFTSGSTGVPKGVVIDHASASNTCSDLNQRFNVSGNDMVFAVSELSFDLSVYDIFGVLGAGGSLALPDSEKRRDPAHWLEVVRETQTTIWNSAPALMTMLVEYCEVRSLMLPDSLRLVLLSGDWIPPSLPARIRLLAPAARIISMGGATEASIWSILYEINTAIEYTTSIPYGHAMANQSFHVLDSHLNERPVGVTGELYIGGSGLALGYFDEPELTDKHFIRHPQTGNRLYRTGDLGRWQADGDIEFQGRQDFQVKIQGFRVELGEIESALNSHEMIKKSVVVAQGKSGASKRLAAYYVPAPNSQALTDEQIKSWLIDRLPAYMVPLLYKSIDDLPLSSNGKVDRKKLPELQAKVAVRNKRLSATGRVVADIFAEVLDLPEPGQDISFFSLGGTSVDMVRLQSEVLRRYDINVSIADLFRYATIRSLAEHLDSAKTPATDKPEMASKPSAQRAKMRNRRLGARSRQSDKAST